jgi:hypothetical protein
MEEGASARIVSIRWNKECKVKRVVWVSYEIVENDERGGFIVFKALCCRSTRVIVAERRMGTLQDAVRAIGDMHGFSHEELDV